MILKPGLVAGFEMRAEWVKMAAIVQMTAAEIQQCQPVFNAPMMKIASTAHDTVSPHTEQAVYTPQAQGIKADNNQFPARHNGSTGFAKYSVRLFGKFQCMMQQYQIHAPWLYGPFIDIQPNDRF